MKVNQHPIFIVGCPRSGTTLLQSLLATQPDVVSFPETRFFELFDSKEKPAHLANWKEAIASFEATSGTSFLSEFMNSVSDQPNGEAADWRKQVFENLIYLIIKDQVPEAIVEKLRWVEKTPFHVFHLDTIHSLYPESKIVNITRDPRDTIYSMKKKLPGMRAMSIPDLAALWKSSILAFNEFNTSTPDLSVSIRYEDLATNPAGIIEKVCDFVGTKFESSRLENRRSVAEQIRHSSESWKTDVSHPNIKAPNTGTKEVPPLRALLQLQSIAGEEMVRYGYRLKYRPIQKIHKIYLNLRASSVSN